MTRVLIIVQNLPVPFDRRVWLECQTLISDGHQVAVVCPKGGGDPAYEVINTVALYKYRPYAPGGSKLSSVTEYAYSFHATAWLTLKARRSGRFGVVQAYNPPDIFWPIALALRALDGTRFVCDHHDLCPEFYESRFLDGPKLPYKVLRALERSTHRTAGHVIPANESCRDLAVTRSGKSEDLRGLPRTDEVHVHLRSWRFWLLVLAGVTAAVTAVATVVLPVARPEKSVARPEKVGYNGIGLTPLMGWSTWKYIGGDPSRANVDAQAAALKSSGLVAAGYKYVIIDDDYYACPGSEGPDVDRYGRWVVARSNFPAVDGVPGLEVVANYVHSERQERFGLSYLVVGRTGCPRWPRSSAACSAIRPSRSAAPFAAACLQLPGPAMLLRAPGTSSVDRRSIRNDLAFTNSQHAGICAERRIGAVGELPEGPWAMGHICQFLAPCLLPAVRPHVSLSRDGRKV